MAPMRCKCGQPSLPVLLLVAGAAIVANGCGGDDACDPTQAACGNPPVSANAGADRDVALGASVTLDASGSEATDATLAWRQLAGPPVGTLTGTNPSFTAPGEVATLVFELTVTRGAASERDTVGMWVLEDPGHAYWVSPSGSDANAGTRAEPFATVQAAIEASHATGTGGDVYVAAGDYPGGISARSGVSVYGGFDPSKWVRDVSAHRPTIRSDGVVVQGLADAFTLDGLRLEAADATSAGGSSIAVHLHDNRGVVIQGNVIVAGNGGDGADGAPGVAGAPGGTAAIGAGARSCLLGGTNDGGAGAGFYGAGGTGGAGHATSGSDGSSAPGPLGGSGGGGGPGAGYSGGHGTAGGPGAPGTHGMGGGPLGTARVQGYGPSPGAPGQNGGNGGGGGGGGGAGGYFTLLSGYFCGPGGGGGGGGGQGGEGGAGGGGGGASIGVLLTGETLAWVTGNSISTGSGGTGGRGGDGGSGGGRGGTLGPGVPACDADHDPCTGIGGQGGDGGAGGAGGHGGGGGGGPSIGILQTQTAAPTVADNVFTLGNPGAGGSSSGSAGAAGRAGEHVIVP
jgi:hypothetical protein